MKVAYLLSLILTASSMSFSQSLRIEQDELFMTYEELLNTKLNGKVKIDHIYDLDEKYNKLNPLGTPNDIVIEEVKGVGRKVTFFYEGLILYYENLFNPNLELAKIEITKGATLEFMDGKDLKAGKHLSAAMSGNKNQTAVTRLENKNSVRINVENTSYYKFIIEQDSSGITKVAIWP